MAAKEYGHECATPMDYLKLHNWYWEGQKEVENVIKEAVTNVLGSVSKQGESL